MFSGNNSLLHGNQQETGVSEGNEKAQGIKIPGIARIHPGHVNAAVIQQAVIQIAVQQPYKLTINCWLLPNNMELIDTRRQVDTNKITLL